MCIRDRDPPPRAAPPMSLTQRVAPPPARRSPRPADPVAARPAPPSRRWSGRAPPAAIAATVQGIASPRGHGMPALGLAPRRCRRPPCTASGGGR
eukprot:4380582-Alexandrium_andersonii.AAC.1